MEASDLVAPSTPPQLSFCYGVPPQLNRVGYSSTGDIVMGLGSKGIVYDKSSHTMRFFQGSQNLVSAFACSGAYGAVAEVENCVHVFGTETGAHCGSLPASEECDAPRLLVGWCDTRGCRYWFKRLGNSRDLGVHVGPLGGRRGLCSLRPIPLASVGFVCWGGPSSLCVGGVGDTDAPDILFCDVSWQECFSKKTQSLAFAAYTAGSSVDDTVLAGTPAGQLEVWAGS